MTDNSQVVVKINYQGKAEKLKQKTHPQMVSEWDIKRILIVATLLILLIGSIIYFFTSESPGESETEKMPAKNLPTQAIKKQITADKSKAEDTIKTAQSEQSVNRSTIKPPTDLYVDNNLANQSIKDNENKASDINKKPSDKNNNQELLANNMVSEESTVIKDNRIVRALITSGLINKEPVDIIGPILTVNKKEATAVYYFTEIINMKGEALYHHWLWNDQVKFKRKINILGNRWRAATSKLIIYSQVGIWKVRLVSAEDEVLNEIQFEVLKK